MEEITNKKGVPVGAVVGITILVAIIFGAGAYMYANNQATGEKDALNAQIVTLQNEVLSAKKVATTTSNSSTPATNTDDKVASTEKPSVPSDWKTYKNTKYGFSLTLNDLWKNYSIIDRKPELDRDGEAAMTWIESYLYVCVPTTSKEWSELDAPAGTFCPFTITAVKAGKYEEYKKDMGEMAAQYVNKNSSYVFLYRNSQDGPDDGNPVANDSSNIISTFKLLQ